MKRTYAWLNAKVEAKDVNGYGKGVFAIDNLKKDELIAVWGGYIMDIENEQFLPENIRDNAVQISEDLVLGIKEDKDLEDACYFNHSCNPNVGFKGQIFVVAMRDIVIGEQLVFDYAMVLYKSKKGVDYNLNCLCGEKVCRKKITNNDWMMKELQEKYKGYFQYYLEEKIKIQNNK